MIRAVIFDCFGVLTTDGWLAFKNAYLKSGSDEEREAIELNHQADAGFLSQSEFEARIAVLADVPEIEVSRLINGHVRNDQLFEYIRDKLKSNYKIGLLSNAADNYLPSLFEEWQVGLFDEVTFSFEVKIIKPDARMYETIAVKLGCLPEECIFIDDREPFVEGARQVGMQALRFTSNQETQAELEALLHDAKSTT